MWGERGDTGGVAVTSQGITVINTCVGGGAGEGVRLKQGGGKSELSGGSQFLLLYLD